jgi:acyl-CoA thioester hydrolase
VAFYETDAMGVVHHSNFVRYLELSRTAWLEVHDRPYTHYVDLGIHLATTRVEVDYLRSLRFADEVAVCTWIEWIRHASMRMAYTLHSRDELVATAATEHAAVDTEGRVRRIPRERRDSLRTRVAPGD